jgi:hypothetical protein
MLLTDCAQEIALKKRGVLLEDEVNPEFVGILNVCKYQSLAAAAKADFENEIARALRILHCAQVIEDAVVKEYQLSVSGQSYVEEVFGKHPLCYPPAKNQDIEISRLCEYEIDAIINGCVASGDGRRYITAKSFVAHRKIEVIAHVLKVHAEDVARCLVAKGASSETVADLALGSISYVTGVAFGRWDIRHATGEKSARELPDPFAPLPVCPPGQLQNAQGFPVEKTESEKLKAEGYPIEIPWDGILVEDPNHPLDIERRVCEVIEIIWKDRAEAIEHEACEILGEKSLRDYFRKPAGFFADHLKRYSKSRRQAPIYWPLSTTSGSYTLWIYYHRLTADTLYKCLQDFVEPKLREVEQDLTRLRAMQDSDEGGRRTDDQLAKTEEFRTELLAFRDELAQWAPRWKPNLNDGVQITASPLWKLFLLPKWRKTLESTWKELEKGDYDWAHLSYSLWPARVRERCKSDRSLAIAHGLEDICQLQPPATKKRRPAKKAGVAKASDLDNLL